MQTQKPGNNFLARSTFALQQNCKIGISKLRNRAPDGYDGWTFAQQRAGCCSQSGRMELHISHNSPKRGKENPP
ncbi:MAG: hypothetical protein ACRD1C_01355 [Terriglobales bacterium]